MSRGVEVRGSGKDPAFRAPSVFSGGERKMNWKSACPGPSHAEARKSKGGRKEYGR
jgi:hypothetical protein